MRRILLVLAPGRYETCASEEEARDVLRLAHNAGLVADIAPDRLTVRCATLARAAAPGLVESMLATERARVATLEEMLHEERTRRAS